MSRRFPTALLAVVGLLLFVPGGSSAAVMAGSIDDGPGGGHNAQQDIRTVAVVYDDAAGSLRGAVSLAEAPTAAGVGGIEFTLGTWVKQTGLCDRAADVTLFPPTPGIDRWYGGLTLGDSDDGPEANIQPEAATVRFEVTATEALGQKWNCGRAETFGSGTDATSSNYNDDDETDVFSLTIDEAQRPAAPPRCAVQGDRVRRGRKMRLRCTHATGTLTIRFYRSRKLRRATPAKIGAGGRVRVSTRALPRGWYTVSAWRGDAVLGYGAIKVR